MLCPLVLAAAQPADSHRDQFPVPRGQGGVEQVVVEREEALGQGGMPGENAEDVGGRARSPRLPWPAGAAGRPQDRQRVIHLRVPVGGRPRRNPWLAQSASLPRDGGQWIFY